jgi:putative membrane protein
MQEVEMSGRVAVAGLVTAGLATSGLLFWLLYARQDPISSGPYAFLPAVNAFFNAMSALCLSLGYAHIRRGQPDVHRRFMLTACAFSGLFLIGYLVYHTYHGDTPFLGQGPLRYVYFGILISHIALSVVVLPMALVTLFWALRGRFDRHPRIARFTLPLWLYVSVTGVLVFLFLRFFG